ncbi:C40 family peptidase [Hymenobacter sp. BRD67]|uniref:C40 family peptidase n=1 Tax=Hymenobacter sp. BRD67 TaxID=2675877 RepID=UPI00156628A2|nr:C40 family peptidase [Hymenobacter sp. BRD67]QKG52573.1 C40 family peptidase [Hymenobacter sp. BRD67]
MLLGLRFYRHPPAGRPAAPGPAPASAALLVAEHAPVRPAGQPGNLPVAASQRDSLVRFALRQLGTPYVYAGTSPATGFDCSGFVRFVFGRFGVDMPHSTALLLDVGRPVPRAQAQAGDIVVFTGTAAGSTTPGHAGIIISAPGETPLRFVHASSARRESGVKISQVEGSGYEQRFMQVRRVLDNSTASAAVGNRINNSRTAPAYIAARPATAVVPLSPLPARAVAVPATPLPKVVLRPVQHRIAAGHSRAHRVNATGKKAPGRHSAVKAKPAKKPARRRTTLRHFVKK